jgi:hypothetical protein
VTFGGRYIHSPLIVEDGTQAPADAANTYIPSACPGGRPPHAWLPDGSSLFDHFNFEWTLLVLGKTRREFAQEALKFSEAASQFHLDLKVLNFDSQELLALYEANLVLIRPDQIVAWRGSNGRNKLLKF